ncbi:Flavin monooxygenase FMO [Penicillium verhagenii]|nr:Flavin monooxygenase FMO [Penicillium verhagenii]
MNIERIAIIGAGPCGLGVAKYLLAEKKFKTITLFEQRDQPGGVWNYTGDEGTSNNAIPIPNPSPSTTPQQPVNGKFISPVYDSLETNIPNSMMGFCDYPFPDGTALFPTHVVVKDYLHRYADELRDIIKLQTLVLDVSMTRRHPRTEWVVAWRDLKNNQVSTAQFDAVVVANGHHNDPHVPDIQGLAEWDRMFPGSISHSSSYRRAESFANKKVIVVGHSASGIDIASQISQVSQLPLMISERTETALSPEKAAVIKALPEISLLDPKNGRVRFANGHEERGVDHIVFCTGYHFSLPFLSALRPSIITDGLRPQNLYQHMFFTAEPTLALIGFPQRIVPFPISQAQGAWVARIFSGRLALPSQAEMVHWIEEWKSQRGDGRNFNILAFPLDAEYINYLHHQSSMAVPRDGLENNGSGKQPPFWGEKEKWTRARFPLIKKASQALGHRRREVTSLEQLGFGFEETLQDTGLSKAHL